MRTKRSRLRISMALLSIVLLAVLGLVSSRWWNQDPVINVQADLDQPSTRIPALFVDSSLRESGFPGALYNTGEYDLVAEKVQDDLDPRDISVGVTARQIDPADLSDVVSLGTIGRQPLMFIARSGSGTLTSPAQLRGKRIQIGPPGSISSEVGVKVLGQFDVTSRNSTFLTDKRSVAATQIQSGTADAMLSLFSPDDKSLDGLLAQPGISLIPTPATQAVAGRIGYLVAGTVPQGAVSVARNIPPTDLPAVSVPITVIANSTISRAAAYDIAQVLAYRFGRATVLAGPDEYPQFTHYLPSDPAAADFYANGVIPWQYRLLAAPIADLFIPIAVIGTIILLVFSIYGALLPSVYEAWVDRLVPHVRAKRESKARSTDKSAGPINP